MEDNNLKSVTESLYKQNLELAVKNKTLSLLSKLYEISILTLEPKELAKKVNDTIQADFSFELIGVFLYNQEKDELLPLAFTESERFHNTESDLGTFLETIVIPHVSESVFLSNVIKEKTMSYTENLTDVWGDLVSQKVFERIKSDGHVQSSMLYPLIIEGRVIGVLILSINRLYADLVHYEKESIDVFVNVIAVALDKALLYEQLTITNVKLKEANSNQASLMHFMNHQVKGRFGNTKNIFAELLTGDYGEMPGDSKPLLEKGLEEAEIGINYVQGILHGASAESGKLPYDMQPIDFKTIVEMVIKKQKENIEKKGLSLKVTMSDGNYNTVGDSLQLGEAVRNLIDNAISYTPKGDINVSLSNTGKFIRLQIQDTGVGVTEEDKPKLFKSGGRGSESLKVNVNATGYGLAFVRGVIEAHKGRVWVESEGYGKGSTFFIELHQT